MLNIYTYSCLGVCTCTSVPPSGVPFVEWGTLTALGDSVLMAAISIYEDEDDWTVSVQCSQYAHTRVLE